jgi:hypothetical protein
VFSDYYHHGPTEEHAEAFTPHDKFKKNLFDDFTEHEWNLAINLAAQCLKVYLKFEKINPPMSNVTKRKLKSIMGDSFHAWADVYFSRDNNKLDYELVRDEVQDECLKKNNLGRWTPQRFMKALKAWCQFHGYVLNPMALHTTEGRIIRRIENISREMLYVDTKGLTPKAPVPKAQGVKMDAKVEGDMPF